MKKIREEEKGLGYIELDRDEFCGSERGATSDVSSTVGTGVHGCFGLIDTEREETTAENEAAQNQHQTQHPSQQRDLVVHTSRNLINVQK